MVERVIKGCDQIFNGIRFNNLKEIINNTKEEFGNCTAFKFKNEENKEIYKMLYNDYIDEINALGTALISIGLKGKRIAIISENRYEWEEAYLAIAGGTGIVVPLNKLLPENEIISLIESSGVAAIFYSSKYNDIIEKTKIKFRISMDLEEKTNEIYSQKELIKLGKELLKNGARSFVDVEINNDDIIAMLFDSKANSVMLSHKNICTNIYDISSMFDINSNDLFLSSLPLHQLFECIVGFLYPVSVGAGISFCEDETQIINRLKEFQATAMISASRVYENIYGNLMQKIEKEDKLKSVKFNMKFITVFKKISGLDLRKKVFKDIHESLGGRVRIFIAGMDKINPEVEKAFNELGINTYQSYELKELHAVVSTEHQTCVKYGSVGKILPSLEAKIIEPNEMGIGKLVVRGPSIINSEKENYTEDGWLLTGDMGYFDKDYFLFITN